MDKFSNEIHGELQYYVYRLIDPRNGQTFYVGKGKGNRVFAHVRGAVEEAKQTGVDLQIEGEEKQVEDEQSLKISTIRDIINAGLEVMHIIQRWGMTADEAFLVESAIIDCFSNLTNIQGGHDGYHGVNNAITLENMLKKEEYKEPDDIDYIIIKINHAVLETRNNDVYETARRAWKLNLNNARRYKYVIAVLDGIVKEVYDVQWIQSPTEPERIEFNGVVAEKSVRDIFIDKKLPEKYRKKGMSSPALYCKKD